MDTEQLRQPADAILGTFQLMNELTSNGDALSSYPESTLNVELTYDFFLGVEKTPANVIFGNAIIYGLILQPVLLYTTWALFPSLGRNRKGLAWTLTFYGAIVLTSLTLCEIGYLRTTLWSMLGWEASGPDATSATIFSHLIPSFSNWVHQLRPNSSSISGLTLLQSASTKTEFIQLILKPQTLKDIAIDFLQWFISLPLFSLAPLKTPLWYSPTAPYYLGGGGRLLISMENFPRESWFSSALCGYFVSYSIGDLALGFIHYRKHIDPASGYIHHIIYTLLIYRLSIAQNLSMFMMAGGLFEGAGNMFPHLREDFWFPLSFVMGRIVYHIIILHEVEFNQPTVYGGPFIYLLALFMHIFWFTKYWQGRNRRLKKRKGKGKDHSSVTHVNGKEDVGSTTGSSVSTSRTTTTTTATFQLRAKNVA
ncbi:hypothetical protein BGZ76_007192 [Entomortierella beljakovae]|nr:hypothetical protein BGZ76_007192 [Entomortierella beljakovae]